MATNANAQKRARANERMQKLRQQAIDQGKFETPHFDHDVTTGRGNRPRDLKGNVKFRSIVDPFCEQYEAANDKEKKKILRDILEITKRESMKFLVQVQLTDNSNAWIQQPVPEVLARIRQRLCDSNRNPLPASQVQPNPHLQSNLFVSNTDNAIEVRSIPAEDHLRFQTQYSSSQAVMAALSGKILENIHRLFDQ